MKKLSMICLSILAISFFASCRGPQGPAGHDGNANVASAIVTVRSGQWDWNNLYIDIDGHERGQFSVTIDFNAITNNVFEHGAVLVYMDVEGAWTQLPFTYYYVDGDYLCEASIEVATLDDGGVNLIWTESDFWKVRPETHDFKIVAIEANYFESRSDVDYSDYNAVKAAFQLAD